MPFEVFERLQTGRGATTSARATLGKSGIISLNTYAINLFDETPEAVMLMYDRKRKLVGLQAVPRDDPNGYVLRPLASGKSFSVNARAFAQHFELTSDKTRRYDVEKSTETENLITFRVT